jgi:two-component system nitrate/nitrite response regulator NarL
MAVSILLVDDHALFLAGLQLMLGANSNVQIKGVCKNGQEALEFLDKNKNIDLILMDINMPVMNGYETSIELAEHYPDIKIIALSMYVEHTNIKKMLEVGVHGYVYKNADSATLLNAITTVMQHDYYVEDEAQYILTEYLAKKKDESKGYHKFKKFELTKREKEIVSLIIDGLTNNEIAKSLFVSNRTIDTHRKNVLSKLGLKNTATLVKYALDNKVYLGID